MSEQKSSYRQIMKATSLFGGVQVFNIIIGIVRSKFLAVLLGPAGMGIAGLINSTIGLITSLTNFGLSTSAVKNISQANATENIDRISTVVSVFKRLVWITGLLGTLVTFILAPLLSKFTFNNEDYTIAFRLVSITLLISQLSNGQMVVLQGMRKLKYLASANMIGAVVGLLVSIPVYYFLGIKGIVPAILISSFLGLALTFYFSSKVKIPKKTISISILKQEGTSMVKMGFMLSLSNLIGLGVGYILGIFINKTGGVEQVGLYNAGFAIVNSYIGMVFAAMATDYFPRLSSAVNDNKKSAEMINHQAEIGILIIAPILVVFLVFIGNIVGILYSSKFFAINSMMQYVALGIFLKTVTWAMGFMIIAKGDLKIFFFSELVTNIYTLLLNMLFYKMYGLNGIGISFILCYSLALLQTYFVINFKYNFVFKFTFYKIFSIQFFLAILCFIVVHFISGGIVYLISLPLILLTLFFSFKELNKNLDIVEFVKSKLQKKIN